MTRVSFYFNAPDRFEAACKLAAKAYQAGQHTLLYTEDAALAARLDSTLWTAAQLSFLPHVRCGHPQAAKTPVLIGADPTALASHDVLINLSDAAPGCFPRFTRLIEVIPQDAAGRQAGRQRWQFYRERGYALDSVDLTQR